MKPVISPSPAGATDTLRIGPDCFASADQSVICWRGRNYVPQEEPEAVHICGDGCTARHDYAEGPEDAARRYAGRLLALQEGLRSRGYDLSMVTEDDMVQFALDALDEARADAKANARMITTPDWKTAADGMIVSAGRDVHTAGVMNFNKDRDPAERPD